MEMPIAMLKPFKIKEGHIACCLLYPSPGGTDQYNVEHDLSSPRLIDLLISSYLSSPCSSHEFQTLQES